MRGRGSKVPVLKADVFVGVGKDVDTSFETTDEKVDLFCVHLLGFTDGIQCCRVLACQLAHVEVSKRDDSFGGLRGGTSGSFSSLSFSILPFIAVLLPFSAPRLTDAVVSKLLRSLCVVHDPSPQCHFDVLVSNREILVPRHVGDDRSEDVITGM